MIVVVAMYNVFCVAITDSYCLNTSQFVLPVDCYS